MTDKSEQLLINYLESEFSQMQSMQALGQIIGPIAHDLNNNLGLNMGYTSMVLSKYSDELPEKIIKYLESAMKASELMKDKLAQILELSHQSDETPQSLNVQEQLKSYLPLLNYHYEYLGKQPVKVDVDLDKNLKNIHFSSNKLFLLLRIIIDNARESMSEKGEIKLKAKNLNNIQCECSDCNQIIQGNWVAISICDQGSGIQPEQEGQIFKPFYTTKANHQGLGLAMLHAIFSRAEGHCIIELHENGGTCFKLLFPVLEDDI